MIQSGRVVAKEASPTSSDSRKVKETMPNQRQETKKGREGNNSK